MAADPPAPVPPQWQPQAEYDFRHMASGPRGYKVNMAKSGNLGTKRKLDEYQKQVRALGAPGAAVPPARLPPLGGHPTLVSNASRPRRLSEMRMRSRCATATAPRPRWAP